MALAFALGGCGGAPPAGAQAPNSEAKAGEAPSKTGFDFDATYAREASGLSEHAVQGPEAAWSAKVPASAAPKLSHAQNSELIEIPIGSKSVVRCQLFSEMLDAGGTLHSVLKESAARVDYRGVAPSGVSLIGGVPAVFLETLYLTDTAGGKGAGGLKLAIQVREQESLLCVHDELGYRKTFKDVSGAFFASFALKSAHPNVATYTEESKAKLGETDVGFSRTRVVPGEKPGEREYNNSNTTLIPTSEKDVVFEDSYQIYSYDAKNALTSGAWVESRAGEITLKVGVKRAANGKYAYQGEVKGKPLSGVLKAPNGIATSLDIAARLKKKLKAGGPFELVLSEYHPAIEPNALIDVTYRHQKGDPARQVVMSMSGITVTSEVDDDGVPKTAWTQVGKQRLSFERLKSEGHL